ncbi:hypothetical protein Pfo_022494 [Paulownia fortunei]|nr:hypothetical protein Pfo_022494 [Paulownia fortunei]
MAGNENRSGVIEDRGREPIQTQSKKKRDQSKTREGSSWECIMEDMGERLEIVEHNIEMLEGYVLEQLDSLKENVQACLNTDTLRDDRLMPREANVMDALQAMQISIKILRENLAVCKKAATTGELTPAWLVQGWTIPNSMSSMAGWTPRKLNLTDEVSRVRTTTLYLTDTAILWWRRKHTNIERGSYWVDTWEDFKKELKQHFYPENIIYEARTIREYVKDFTTIMLQIPNLSEEDLLFHFVDDVKSVDEAIAVVESLTEYQPQTNASKKKEKWNPTKGGGEKRNNRDQRKTYPPKGGDRNPSRKEYEEKKRAFVPKGGCFVCKRPHAMSNCPKLGTSNIGSIRLLNAPNAKPLPTTSRKGLMYVEAYLSGKSTRVLVDTGATHNFITEEEANRLGLRWSRGEGWLKTVNAKAQPLNGVVKNVVLDMDFLRKVPTIPMPSFSSVCILEKGAPCMIPTIDLTEGHSQGTKAESRHLSAIQITKGVKWGETTYLATLKEEVPTVTKEDDLPPIIQNVLEENKDVMPDELPKKLPPRQEVDHKIELEPGTKPPAMARYHMAPLELEELRRQLIELLDTGWIRPSKAPYCAPMLFQKKHDGSLRMCVDYRVLNKVTIKNRYPIPLIADLFDRLRGAKIYTKMDLQKGYYQVRIAEGDEPKTACITRYGYFEWLIFQPYLDRFMVLYLDDIVIYSNSLEEHANHLPKIRAIVEWEAPTKVTELRFFLGLVNYYYRFIQGYSARAAPLTDLLKKRKTWEWSEKYQHAFDDLKVAVSNEPVLALSNFDKPFELHTDASDFAIGGVLMQEGHPIAFESRKLNNTERRYTVQEKEMTTIIHCLWVWRHYLLDSHFIIKTDNDFLAKFDYTLEYKLGKANVVADALIQKAELAAVSLAKEEITDLIKQGLEQDPLARELKNLAVEGKTK